MVELASQTTLLITMQEHIRFRLSGKVQGVGFRPFVFTLANKLNLNGYAINQINGLDIYLYADKGKVELFEKQLFECAPKHAIITQLSKETLSDSPNPTYKDFEIRHLKTSDIDHLNQSTPTISSDRGLCKRCLVELFDVSNKRFLHPFISCIECGPRASITKKVPYDRTNTSYQNFKECDECRKESSQLDQEQTHRFHSQTNACWECGPSLGLYQQGKKISVDNFHKKDHYAAYFEKLSEAIKAGKIIAMKGLSGFHLLCDARNKKAIAQLRAFKHRPEKPFAIMALNCESLKEVVDINDKHNPLLEKTSAPIVLLPKKILLDKTLDALAPGVGDLGCMLPYTAMHYLLFHALLGKPEGQVWLSTQDSPLLVVTSANLAGEPLISDNQECLDKLSRLAEYILCHDRNIVFPSDDSVIQASQTSTSQYMMIRRARGFAPEPIYLPFVGKKVLALGAHLKHTFCLCDGQLAFLSPHLGEPDSIRSYDYFEATLNLYLNWFGIQPELIACDMHPDYFSSRFARQYAETRQVPLIQIPHHQAHIASTLAESHLPLNTAFIGLALDGLGLGENKTGDTLWGGELFSGKLTSHGTKSIKLDLQHNAHISSLSLPGGDQATKEIGRIGFALLNTLQDQPKLSVRNDFSISSELKSLIETHSANFPRTSSLGRWFDAISSLIGLRQKVSYEGQAAMELEALAAQYGSIPKSKHLAEIDNIGNLDLYPCLPRILSANSMQEASAIFHSELIDGLLRWILKIAQQNHTQHVVCSGGCFQNRILRNSLYQSATKEGLILHYPKQVPVNDAGISLGQALMASLT